MDYIGETERNLKARFMEHRRPSSTSSEVSRHIHDFKPDHTITMKNVRILDREPSWFERGVREAINIRVLRPALNKDGGQLSHTWDRSLTSLTPTISGVNRSQQ